MSEHTGHYCTAHAQRTAAWFMERCAAGDCQYRDPKRHRRQCESDDAACHGYEGHVYLEDLGPVLRWRRCPRFKAWFIEEKKRIAARQLAAERQKRAPKAPWENEA